MFDCFEGLALKGLVQLICLQSSFLFQHGKEATKTYHSSLDISVITGNILNDKKICRLQSSYVET